MKVIREYLDDRQGLDRDMFVSKHAYPVLLHRGELEAPPAGNADTGGAFKTMPGPAFKTSHIRIDKSTGQVKLAQPSASTVQVTSAVFPIVKRPDGIYSDRISVGRTRNSDVQIPFPQISKFHAYFTQSEDRRDYFLVDAGSTNGTILNKQKLVTNTPSKLASGAEVQFGPYVFEFLLPSQFYDFLTTATAAAAP